MIVDLHAHYPMHFTQTSETSAPEAPSGIGDIIRAGLLKLANLLANYPDDFKPAVTIAGLRDGEVDVALSVLYLPFDEIDLSKGPNAPPAADYFEELEGLMDAVERDIAARPDAAIARNWRELQDALTARRTVLIHALEGGFHLGAEDGDIEPRVALLKARGIAYITVAHLFYRQVATNAPALPFLTDADYHRHFPQPPTGLDERGRTLIRCMVRSRILVDVTHMSSRAMDDTFALLDSLDAGRTVPVIATHSACRFGTSEYNLSDEHIRAIAARRGVVGLIVCKHWMSEGLPAPGNFRDSMNVIRRHVDHIHALTGSHQFTAIGSDMDGFIKPPLPGIQRPLDLNAVRHNLVEAYGADAAAMICSRNALRVLEYWGRPAGE